MGGGVNSSLLETYFYIEDISGSENTVSITKSSASAPTLTIEYSTNGSTWNTATINEDTTANTFTIPANGKLYLRGVNNYWCANTGGIPSDRYNYITVSSNYNVGGNIMSLLYGSDFKDKTTYYNINNKSNGFNKLFQSSTTLVNAQDLQLPATTLVTSCYSYMFYNCTNLITAPELPATTLANYCYYYMFSGCSKLTTAPELPATTLATSCYSYMFYNCTSLTTAPELPATTLANQCYNSMFRGTNLLPDCSNIDFTSETVIQSGGLYGLFLGTKVTDDDLKEILPINPETEHYYLPATTLAQYCYYSMFNGCSNLTTAPELPATTLATYCYSNMFSGCTNLTTAPELPATTLADSCYSSMFNGCSKLTTAPELPATTLANQCYQQMFRGCTSLTTAPELPATTLPQNCYNSMFQGCYKLTTAPSILPATTLANYCYFSMFQGCSSLVKAPELPATTLANYCYYYMFSGCSKLTTAPSILPATTLAKECYTGMFQNCTSLTTAPELPATTLAKSCYQVMFFGCGKLNYIKADFINYSNNNNEFTNWVVGVSSTGTFVMDADANYNPDEIRGVNGIPQNWNIKKMTFKLAFENIDTDNINTLVIDNKNKNKLNLKYSLDKTNWIEIDNYPFTIEYDTKIGLSGTNITVDGLQIHCTNLYKLSGNITYLLNEEGDNLLPEDSVNTFKYLFVNDINLTDISGLVFPENTVPNCYHHMFTGCSKLQSLPELPAIDLTKSCYHGMFMDCDELIKVSLPEAYLAPYAYSNMFLGSENLSDVTVTYNEDVDETNYKGWLKGVKTNGIFSYNNTEEVEENTIRNSYNVPSTWNVSKN